MRRGVLRRDIIPADGDAHAWQRLSILMHDSTRRLTLKCRDRLKSHPLCHVLEISSSPTSRALSASEIAVTVLRSTLPAAMFIELPPTTGGASASACSTGVGLSSERSWIMSAESVSSAGVLPSLSVIVGLEPANKSKRTIATFPTVTATRERMAQKETTKEGVLVYGIRLAQARETTRREITRGRSVKNEQRAINKHEVNTRATRNAWNAHEFCNCNSATADSLV